VVYGTAEARGWDYVRARVFHRKLDLHALVGLSGATVEALCGQAMIGDLFRDTPVIPGDGMDGAPGPGHTVYGPPLLRRPRMCGVQGADPGSFREAFTGAASRNRSCSPVKIVRGVRRLRAGRGIGPMAAAVELDDRLVYIAE
jgi:hypothetical protein